MALYDRDGNLYQDNAVQVLGARVSTPILAPGALEALSLDLGIVDVREYASDGEDIGDGATDATSAIQAAIAANPGRTINFPYGTYLVTSPITVSAHLEPGATFTTSGAGQITFAATGEYNLAGRTLRNFYHEKSVSAAVGTGADWVTKWSQTASTFVSQDAIRRLGVRLSFKVTGAELTDIRDLEFEVQRDSTGYFLHNVNIDAVGAVDTAITGSVTGRKNAEIINWRFQLVAGDLQFQVQQDAGTNRDIETVIWIDEARI